MYDRRDGDTLTYTHTAPVVMSDDRQSVTFCNVASKDI